jgi:Na+-transporting NADH:ubiquinone oxidoreductase subunit C
MDRNGNAYTFIYASVMVVLVAAILSVAAINLKPFQSRNVEIEKKQNILKSINVLAGVTEAEKMFDETISESYIVDVKGNKVDGDAFIVNLKKERAKPDSERQMPIYVANIKGEGKKYILPLYGSGLWGAVWGYIALNDDLNTIYGATFDHEKETPGLGAEISTEAFQAPFKGKTIFSESGKLMSIIVAKAGEKAEAQHSVDAISGGTITSKGLQQMILDDLTTYQEFFNKVR